MSRVAASLLTLTDVKIGIPPPGDINALATHEAMGLRPGYAGDAWLNAVQTANLGPISVASDLVAIIEDCDRSFSDRYAAGTILGVLGDPRLDGLNPTMQFVRGGKYFVGTSQSEVEGVVTEFSSVGVKRAWIEKEVPRHPVNLRPYRIAKYPVTNMEYAAFMRDVPTAPTPTSWKFGTIPPAQSNHPVHSLPPKAADDYAQWLSLKTGREYRLPTEAEWEVAAAGSDRIYPWGDAFAADHANTLEAGVLWTTPVGVFPKGASETGCLDMAGNVEEFVSDCFAPYPGGRCETDDLFRESPTYRVARGGSFTRYRDLARCSRRHGWIDNCLYAMGFRLAENVSPFYIDGVGNEKR